ncbi:Uncharacterised protein [uncultured archaeon]|nr:Uncharacterised protein [uncultured archaeon]
MDKMKVKNESGMVSIDLMVAIVLVIAAVMLAILIMPTLSHEDKDWRIKQYMTATRATDNLVQDAGEPGWEAEWTAGNYSNVTKMGFLYIENGNPQQKVLDLKKVKALMGAGYEDNVTRAPWWEYPNSTTSYDQRENAARALGLGGYNFYMELHPVGLNLFNSTPVETNLNNVKVINFDTVTVVDRYVYIADPDNPELIKYLKFDNKAIHYRLNLWVW